MEVLSSLPFIGNGEVAVRVDVALTPVLVVTTSTEEADAVVEVEPRGSLP
jgi:hypothetical protein